MKIQLFLLLLCLLATEGFAQAKKSKQSVSSVYHYGSNISVRNFDGTRSTIDMNGNSATLFNSDGSLSTIELCGNFSTLITVDGIILTLSLNGFSTTVTMPDGTQFFISHMNSTSTCSTAEGKHAIMHTISKTGERGHQKKIDLLLHMNWLVRKKAEAEMAEAQSTK